MTQPSSINEIATANRNAGHHWFDHDTLRWFGCRLSGELWPAPDGVRVYFISSELPPHDRRRYTIRYTDDGGRNIETHGEFCGYGTLATAKRHVRKLTGRDAVGSETFHPFTPAEELANKLTREVKPAPSVNAVGELIRMARRHDLLCCWWCGDGSPQQEQRSKYAEEKGIPQARARIERWCERWGLRPIFSGDPRGCTVKLALPSGDSNSWGGEGWCVPI